MKHAFLGLLLAVALVAGATLPDSPPAPDPHATINAAAVVLPAPELAADYRDAPDVLDLRHLAPALDERAHQLESPTTDRARDPAEESFDLRFIDPVLRVEPAVWRGGSSRLLDRTDLYRAPATWQARSHGAREVLVI